MRKLTAREINHLNKYGIDPYSIDLEKIGDKPVEYITGFTEFYGRDFKISQDVLIPRIETEGLIDLALSRISNIQYPVSFLDLGTGSGAIGLTFAKELDKLNIPYSGVLTDISEYALNIAKQNYEQVKLKGTIKFHLSNLLSQIPNLKSQIIFANLPYIPSERISTLQSSVKDYEPLLALDGGEDGLKYIRKLLNQAKEYSTKDGMILLEVDDTHDDDAAAGFTDWDIQVKKDENGKIRFWIATYTLRKGKS